jgi:GntR family transcriptional regulator
LEQRNAARAAAKSHKRTPVKSTSAKAERSANDHPLYARVVASLKTEILKGTYPVGTQLPSEDILSDQFSVSRHTVREALRRLRDDGLVVSRKGAGTTVLRPAVGQSYVQEVASIDDLFSFVKALRFRVDIVQIVTADTTLAKRIGGSEGEKWLKIAGYRYPIGKEHPACSLDVYVNGDYAGVARLLDNNKGPIFELIETLYGERIVEVEQVFNMSPMPADVAGALNVKAGDVAVEVIRTFRTTSGKMAQVAIAHYPVEGFTFSMKLRRSK